MARGFWTFLALAIIPSVVATYCSSTTCRSHCYCNRCSSAPCRRQRTLLEKLMTYHEFDPESEVVGHEVEDVGHEVEDVVERKLATCPCQSPQSDQPSYCCSSGGTTCGLGPGFPGINGKDGMGNSCSGRCDLVYACASGCCSFDGFCGTTSAYCDNPMSACNSQGSAPFDAFNKWECGYGHINSGRCKSASHCCSKSGYCDKPGVFTSGDHFLTPIGSSRKVWKRGGYVTESYSSNPTYCGRGTVGNGKCLAAKVLAADNSVYTVPANIMCCSPNGYCGNSGTDIYGEAFCATSGNTLKSSYTTCKSNSECLSNICKLAWNGIVQCDVSPGGGKCIIDSNIKLTGDCGSGSCSYGKCGFSGVGGQCAVNGDCFSNLTCVGYNAGSSWGKCTGTGTGLKSAYVACSSNSECLSNMCKKAWNGIVQCDVSPGGGNCIIYGTRTFQTGPFGGGDCGSGKCSDEIWVCGDPVPLSPMYVCVNGLAGQCAVNADCSTNLTCVGYKAGTSWGKCSGLRSAYIACTSNSQCMSNICKTATWNNNTLQCDYSGSGGQCAVNGDCTSNSCSGYNAGSTWGKCL